MDRDERVVGCEAIGWLRHSDPSEMVMAKVDA